MKIETREIYRCSFCGKTYLLKHMAKYHESICGKNPDNHRPCHDCIFLNKKATLIYSGQDNYNTGDPINVDRDFLYCEAKGIFLYTPKNEARNNYHHVDEDGGIFENNPMPKLCSLMKPHGSDGYGDILFLEKQNE